jgi:DNA topoisomerase IB
VSGIVKDVSEELGNTPAVARASYIDPRLFDLWERGETIGATQSQERAEEAVLDLLG